MPHDGWHPHNDDGLPTRRFVLAAATFLPFGGASAQSAEAGQRIAEQASRFVGLLDDGQRRCEIIWLLNAGQCVGILP